MQHKARLRQGVPRDALAGFLVSAPLSLSLIYDQLMIRMTQAACVAALLALGASGPLDAQKPAQTKTPPRPATVAAKVYLTPTCGCCSKWADHMKAAGFDMERDVRPQAEYEKIAPKQKVPARLRSCHTAVIGKYIVEGHVPADVVRQLLREAPASVVGLSAPNMPLGSPGMESPNAQPYPIVAFRADGSTYEFARPAPNR